MFAVEQLLHGESLLLLSYLVALGLSANAIAPASGNQVSPRPAELSMPAILPLERRAQTEDRWLERRFETLLPRLMRRDNVTMWILVAGEYNEDPVVETMLPATWLHARRRTILVFFDPGEGKPIEKLALARYPIGDFAAAWNPDVQPDQWAELAKIIAERNPATIALNRSEIFPLADGLSSTHYEAIRRAIGPDYSERLVAHDRLALGWLETRIPEEVATYPTLSRITHAIIEEAFSERVITPGVTTSDDVVWYLRNRVAELKLDTWFHPSVAIQRHDGGTFGIQEMGHRGNTIIMPGDVLHVDFGIQYLGLNTDVQRMGYVLRPGEVRAPKGLRDGLAAMNRVRDANIGELKAGRSGDEALGAARKHLEAGGIDGTIYTHPIGHHGHGAGTWIGAWENQQGVPGVGKYRIYPNTAWSIELNARHDVPEWGGQKVRFMHEENGFLAEDGSFRFFDGAQEDFILVPRP